MIIGHLGPAFATRRLWPRVPMIVLLIGTFLPDIVRLDLTPLVPTMSDANLYSHTLPWLALVAIGGALLAGWLTRQRESGWAVFALVLAHVLLDLISGNKELWIGGPSGINLDYRYWQYEFLIELALLVGGWLLLGSNDGGRGSPRGRLIVALALLEFLVLASAIYERPWVSRCWSWPFRTCDDSSLLTVRWEHPWSGLQPR